MTKKFLAGQSIILAAGNGTRIRPFSSTKPKPLLKILEKTILEHNLDQLKGMVKEIILVIGSRGELIKKKLKRNYKGMKIRYVWQKNQMGTGHAAFLAANFIEDKFLLLNGDDIYLKEDIKKLVKKFPAISAAPVKNPENFGVVLEKNGKLLNLIEKPKKPSSNLVNTGLYFLPKKIFQSEIQKSKRGEFEFTDYIKKFTKDNKLNVVKIKDWIPINFGWDLFGANEFLFEKKKSRIEGKVEKNVRISGKVIIEKGAVVRSGSYIIGPVYLGKNSIVGPNCFLREGSVVGNNCKIGQAVEIKNSIIGDNTNVSHLSYIGDSIVGENCNFGAGVILANLRFDQNPVKVKINKKIIDTKREKLGAIIGDNVKIGVNASLMPGVLIGPNCVIGPNSLVKENIGSGQKYFFEPNRIKRVNEES